MSDTTIKAKCASAVLGESKQGNEQVVIVFESDAGKLWYYGGFKTEAQSKQTIKALRACGWRGDDIADLSTCKADVELVTYEETYNGKQQTKVRYVNALNSTPALAAERARSFAEKMKRRLASLEDSKSGGERDEEPPPPSDSDVPF
jgi:hypothetical protein